jgi:hypothetical protein
MQPINDRPINPVKWPIHRLIVTQQPTEQLPVTEFPNIGYIFYRVGRNHGASSSFNRMAGSMFTVNGGISSNLL